MARMICSLFINEQEIATWLLILSVQSKLKYSTKSQAITNIIKLVISRKLARQKRCYYWHGVYRIAAITVLYCSIAILFPHPRNTHVQYSCQVIDAVTKVASLSRAAVHPSIRFHDLVKRRLRYIVTVEY